LKDRIKPGVRVLFVGINPGVRSAMTGHHFAGFSNRFWKLLLESGLVPEPITFEHDDRLPEFGFGITNLIPRPSPGINDLVPSDYIEGWKTLDRKTTGAGGAYRLRDRMGSTLSAPARVVTGSADGLAGGYQRVGRLNVYRYAHVSWYGPGLYGGHLACGGTLEPGTLGVANKSLPCGSKVTLHHHGHTVRVRVIDRGPYVAGREYDLTQATAQRLGFVGHGSMLVTR